MAVNNLGNGKYPRIQAVAILAGAAFLGAIAISSFAAAREGKIVCRPDPDGGGGALSSNGRDCTYPIEYAVASALFGTLATVDTGVALYQLVAGKPALKKIEPLVADPSRPPN